jgi:hypothetical protein
MDVALRTQTGIEQIDHILQGLVRLFELSFPTRVRGYYLSGSYSDGSAIGGGSLLHASDIDLFVVFKDSLATGESTTFHQVVNACRLISPVPLDVHAFSEDELRQQTNQLSVLIKLASVPIYGDDIRDALPLIPFSYYVLNLIDYGVFNMGLPRQGDEPLSYPLAVPLVPPVRYPNPDGEFYGYDATLGMTGRPGTRLLVIITGWIATTLLALEAAQYAGSKTQTFRLVKQHLPQDTRAQLATTIYETCKGRWGYQLPNTAEEQAQLRAWCRDTLALENEYLLLCRRYLLTQLQHGGNTEKRLAARTLQLVIYPDNEVASALEALTRAADEEVRATAAKVLAAQRL